ncbi:MAG TPA: DUF3107 domain-containing protein [Candidatus Nesterenkonia stercoripullorum]|jgi:hypothetical protein|uniref:DUF3107 domain-containing protein n=1 Tax=Candidatus Nesterenkonia stercoripullorum TaxID=2838701 RepID=A0A9D1URX1_9MICC|nr:DUF3107 domain-containing protein [Candidatus Nesterenkonia stercoripullorum]
MEVRIGVQNVTREIVIESEAKPEDIEKSVAEAVEKNQALLSLQDRRGKSILVPVATIGYVEIGSDTKQAVGFAAPAAE